MKCFLIIAFLATATFAMPQHGGPGARPPMNGPHHGHGPNYRPPRPQRPQFSPEMREMIMDLMDFQRLYPVAELEQIILTFIQDDSFRATMSFLETAEFEQIVKTIAESSEIEAVVQFVKNADWPFLHKIAVEAIKRAELSHKAVVSRNTVTGGLDAFLDAIVAVLPKEQLHALFEEKMAKNSVFAATVEIFRSEEFRGLVQNVKNSPVISAQFQLLADNGINFQKIYNTTKAFFGL